jgi:hypothetical protein
MTSNFRDKEASATQPAFGALFSRHFFARGQSQQ